MNLKIQHLYYVILIVIALWQFLRGNNLEEKLGYSDRQLEEQQEVLGELKYSLDTTIVSMEFLKQSKIEEAEKYEELLTKNEKSDEAHHNTIVDSPDSLSQEFLYHVARRYGMLRHTN